MIDLCYYVVNISSILFLTIEYVSLRPKWQKLLICISICGFYVEMNEILSTTAKNHERLKSVSWPWAATAARRRSADCGGSRPRRCPRSPNVSPRRSHPSGSDAGLQRADTRAFIRAETGSGTRTSSEVHFPPRLTMFSEFTVRV